MRNVVLADQLAAITSLDRVIEQAPLAELTTFRVGGPADWLVTVQSVGELADVVVLAGEVQVPITFLGGGSNVLIADRGIRGIVVRFRMREISESGPGRVRAEAGATMSGLVRWTVSRGLAGLEAWAGTPGTVGGAICGNAHYGGQNIGDLVTSVGLMTSTGESVSVPASEMQFGYDASRVQGSHEVVLWAEFVVTPGDVERLRGRARESLAYRKRTQPLGLASAGCVFQNPDPRIDHLPPGVPASAGALIDRAGLKGFRVGGASISLVHGNFVVSDGTATAEDIRAVIDAAREAVRERFGIGLREELAYLGQF